MAEPVEIEVRSNFGGTTIRPLVEAGPPPWWLRLLAPSLDVRAGGVRLAHVAPAGEPSEAAQAVAPVLLVVGGLALVALAVYGAVKLARS